MARVRRAARLVADYAKELGAVASALGAIVALVLVFTSHIGCSSTACQGDPKITEHIDVRPDATWRDFLVERNVSEAGGGDLNARGAIVHPNLVLDHYKGDHLQLKWTLTRANGTAVAAPGYSNQLAYGVKPDRCSDPVSDPIWVNRPPERGRYRVELLVYDVGSGVVLHTSDPSAPFAVS